MHDVWRMNKERSDLIQIDIQARYPGKNLLFHGTSLSNAISIFNDVHARVSNVELASAVCSRFNSTFNAVLMDESNYGHFRDFVFADHGGENRDTKMYTSTRLDQARIYAEIGPEWLDHLLRYFACKDLKIECNFTNFDQRIEDWILPHKETPAIVVFDATGWPGYKADDPIMLNFSRGTPTVIPFPLPVEIFPLEYFEWKPLKFDQINSKGMD